jgi:uncharacterized membrane protein
MKSAIDMEVCSFSDFLRQQHPEIKDLTDLNAEQLSESRKQYIDELLHAELGELNDVEKMVAKSIRQKQLTISHKHKHAKPEGFGDKLADRVAAFGGSWNFILLFLGIIIIWMAVNVVLLHNKSFDPYPFILLNLILSCVAALQAPVIMMSQNRQEEKDRERAEHDYKVNLKAEVEIRMLHEKLDHILLHQNKRLLQIQEVQMEMMESIGKKLGN